MRKEVVILTTLGPLPSETAASVELLKQLDAAYRAIDRPITDEEAIALVEMFGKDGCFGLASSLAHLIETAPSWPLSQCLRNVANPWVVELRDRAIRGGHKL
ncbi:MAG: hypothetical protein EOO15_22065 [Chitinophagaceae bacterium]|nr:MAG: hypothetical protein EOO15_22065 [Chitinophagaceae bacterium]